MTWLLRLRPSRIATSLTAGFGLILLLQIAAFLGASSEASAQQVLTNDYSSGDGFRYYYTYYVAGTQWVLHGFYEVWQGTTIISRENFRNGVRHGASATFFADGDTASLVNYVDGSLEGEASSWYENGRQAEVDTYVSNVLNGPYQKWYETGLQMEKGDYADGVKFMTEWWGWYANGRMSYHREVFGNLTTDNEWYDDGKLKAYTEYMDGRLNGVRKTWDADGSRSEAHYFEGQAHGLSVAWDANGNKTYEARSEYDQIISSVLWSYYGSDIGSVMASESPRDGDNKLHGIHKMWYSSGAIKLIEPYTHGVLHGVRLEWYESGQQSGYSEYRDGQVVGMMRSWHDNGVLSSQAFYVNGRTHGPYTYWGRNGLPLEDGQYANGAPCGIWTRYWSDGRILDTTDNGTCAPAQPTDPDPQATNTAIKRVSGVVYDARTSSPIAGASVGGATSASDGSYSLTIGSPNTYSISCTKPGYDRFASTLDLEGIQLRTLNIRLKRTVSTNTPSVTSVEPIQQGIYLYGVSLPAAYLAQVQWNGLEPGSVSFEVAGTRLDVPATASGASNAFDMGGAPFFPNADPRKNRIKIIARSRTGEQSRPEFVYPAVIPIPPWAKSLGTFLSHQTNNVLVYAGSSKWPQEPLKINIDPDSLGPIAWKAWSLFPIIGGRNFGIPPTQFFLDTEVKTDGSGSLAAGGITGFEVAGGEIGVKLGGKGYVLFKPNFGMELQKLSVLIGCDGTLKRSVGVITVIPALENAINLPVVGRPIAWFNSLAEIEAKIYTGFELDFPVAAQDASLAFGSAFGEIKSGMTLGLIGGKGELKGEISGGGELVFALQLPPLAGKHYLTKAEAKLAGQLVLTVWTYQKRYAFEHSWVNEWKATTSAPPSDEPAPVLMRRSYPLDGPGFVPISASSFVGPNYNRFVGNRTALRAQARDSGNAAESVIIHNAYPYSAPSIAALDDRLAIAYVTFNTNQPAVRATDICLTYSAAEGHFSMPVAVTNDTRADFSPTAAFADSNTVVVAWQRVKDPDFAETNDLPEMAKAMEIAWATYNIGAAQWGHIHTLTDNGYLDHSPMLSRSPDGTLLVAWVANAGNELIGTTGAPDRIWYAFWDAASSTFAEPTCITRDLVACSDYRIANYGKRALLTYSQDLDGDLFGTNSTGQSVGATDQEIFALRIQDATWSEPMRITTNDIADVSPAPRFDSAGKEQLVWLSGSNLVMRAGLETGAPSLVRESSNPVTNFRTIARQDDRVVLVWQGVETNGVDLYYRSYDPGFDSWSEDKRLTQDPQVESDFEGAFAFSNRLCLVYLKKDFATTNTDLCILTRSLTHDLAIVPNGLGCDPATPVPGQPVKILCLVTNSGDFPVSGLTCSFHLGTTAAAPLVTLSLSNTVLRAGAATNLLWQWTAPADTNTTPLVAFVHAAGPLSEIDETNNVASLNLFRPDLEVLDTRIEPSVEGRAVAVAVIRNRGAVTATNLFVRFDADSRLLGVKQAPDVLPGHRIEIGQTFSPALDCTNATGLVTVTVDPDNLVAESDKANNRGEVFGFMRTDANANGIPDWWERFYFGTLVNANDDADGDGVSNLQEFWAQTSPTDPTDCFRVQESSPVQGGTNLVLQWNTQPGWQYAVYMTTDLSTTNEWRLVGAGVSTDDQIMFTNRTSLPQQFYKVQISP